MADGIGDGWLAGLTAQHARREAKHAAHVVRLQDGLGSLMIGVLACGLGLTVSGAWCAARAGYSAQPWSERVVHVRASDGEAPPRDEPFGFEWLSPGPRPVEVAAPTRSATVVSVLGTAIAGLGIAAALRQRRGVPLLCALAIVLCWLPAVVSFLEELVLLAN